MADIGATLREARMRAHLDVSELEARTKIRAKYLRALENEEWNLLPGSTFIKSFLRTYGDALGVDGRMLVEEYKLRHERLSEVEMQPIRPLGAARNARGTRDPVLQPWMWAVAAGVALIVILVILGSSGGSTQNGSATTTTTTAALQDGSAGAPAVRAPAAAHNAPTPERRVSLRIVATAPVFACVVTAGGRRVINGVNLLPGDTARTFRSRRFEVNLGNTSVHLYVDGRRVALPSSSSGVGLRITATGPRPLPLGSRPTCK